MTSAKQAESFRLAAYTAIKARRTTITAVAASIGYARETVSRAINHNEFPEVQTAIAKALGLSHGKN